MTQLLISLKNWRPRAKISERIPEAVVNRESRV